MIKKEDKFNFEEYFKKNNKPLVIFPEATKSNRLAVLPIRSNLMDDIYELIKDNKEINLRTEIVINKNYEINTTDRKGIKSLFNLCSSFYTPVEICSQDIKSETLLNENLEFDTDKYKSANLYKDSIIQEYLMEPAHRNTVSINSFDHEKFIDYYSKTSSDKKANYVKNN